MIRYAGSESGAGVRADARAADRVAIGLRVFGLIALALVVARVVQLQAFPGEQLRAAIEARTSGAKIESVRGDLLDRRGRPLAVTRIGYRVVIDPVNAQEHADRIIVALSAETGLRPDEIGQPLMHAIAENARRIAAGATDGQHSPAGGLLAGVGFGNTESKTADVRGLIRYVVTPGMLTLDQAEAVRALRLAVDARNRRGEPVRRLIRLPGVTIERRSVREIVGGDAVAPLLGKVGYRDWSDERVGRLGAERLYQDRLDGDDGAYRYVRDANGRPLWVDRGAWRDAQRGSDVRMSIDASIQLIAQEELRAGIERADAAGGRAIVFEPHTGELLAMVDLLRDVPGLAEVPWWDPSLDAERPAVADGRRYRLLREDPGRSIEPALGRNRCVEDLYEPGSTFKPFTWAYAYERGLLDPEDVLRPETRAIRTHYGRRIEDVTFRKRLTWDDVLRYSSNIGMYHITEMLGYEETRENLRRLGFGSKTGIGLAGETAGLLQAPSNWTKYTQTSVGMGYEVGVTPLQMVRAFSVFARRGELAGTLPGVRLTADGLDQRRPGIIGDEIFVERVFSPETARSVREPMKLVVEKMDELRLAAFPDDVPARYSMFGKSGTAYIACTPPPGKRRPEGIGGYFTSQYNSSFLVAAPADDPAIVVLVVIDDPGPEAIAERRHYGSWVAGPVVRRIVERALPYMGVQRTAVRDALAESE
ncbi:MAG: penicillin-binding protein 2 [Planctomycetota bacterium]